MGWTSGRPKRPIRATEPGSVSSQKPKALRTVRCQLRRLPSRGSVGFRPSVRALLSCRCGRLLRERWTVPPDPGDPELPVRSHGRKRPPVRRRVPAEGRGERDVRRARPGLRRQPATRARATAPPAPARRYLSAAGSAQPRLQCARPRRGQRHVHDRGAPTDGAHRPRRRLHRRAAPQRHRPALSGARSVAAAAS